MIEEREGNKVYICECGREFDNPQKFNGHKSHCIVHQYLKYGSLAQLHIKELARQKTLQETMATTKQLRIAQNEKIAQESLQKWISEKHICETCGKVMTEKYGSGRFCCRSCANTRTKSEESKLKVSQSLRNFSEKRLNFLSNRKQQFLDKYFDNPSFCKNCGSVLPYDMRNNSACSDECLKQLQIKNGLKSAEVQSNTRRSKNEIAFYTLCKGYFKDVEHNKPIFNGWDADIIIKDIKYAILWNGIWHYKQVRKKQSLKQIQARDAFKLEQIAVCGYTPYVIQDMGSQDDRFVQKCFDDFINHLKSLNIIT